MIFRYNCRPSGNVDGWIRVAMGLEQVVHAMAAPPKCVKSTSITTVMMIPALHHYPELLSSLQIAVQQVLKEANQQLSTSNVSSSPPPPPSAPSHTATRAPPPSSSQESSATTFPVTTNPPSTWNVHDTTTTTTTTPPFQTTFTNTPRHNHSIHPNVHDTTTTTTTTTPFQTTFTKSVAANENIAPPQHVVPSISMPHYDTTTTVGNIRNIDESTTTSRPAPVHDQPEMAPPAAATTATSPFQYTHHHHHPPPHSVIKEGAPVPSTRAGRALGFANLGLGLLMGTMAERARRLIQPVSTSSSPSSPSPSVVLTDTNSDRLAASLCRMRGAALKMGQMLSIQDESLLPPPLVRALQQVRQGADAMPRSQLEQQLVAQLGTNWRDRFVDSGPNRPVDTYFKSRSPHPDADVSRVVGHYPLQTVGVPAIGTAVHQLPRCLPAE